MCCCCCVKMTSTEELACYERDARKYAVQYVWPDISEEAVILKHLSIATTNIVFCCGAPGHKERVCVRFFGKGSDSIVNREEEQQLMTHLGKDGLCPLLIAKIPDGVVQSFVEGVTLDLCSEIVHYHRPYAETLARWHTSDLTLVLPDVRCCIWDRMDDWLKQLTELVGSENASPFVKEAAALHAYINAEAVSRPGDLVPVLCMCHNDTSAFNVVFSHKIDDSGDDDDTCRATLIDLEYADYNDPHFDLGNHICEHSGLEMDLSLWPSDDVQRHFVRQYLLALAKCKGLDPATAVTEEVVELERMRTLRWCLVSHLLWAVWGIVRFAHAGFVPVCGFDHFDYMLKRTRAYVLQKRALGFHTDVPDDSLANYPLDNLKKKK